jgi:hypothetical protein
MAFFSLTDITFNTNRKKSIGPLGVLESSKYESNTFRYPLDLGNYDKGHYMVIHINEQRVTQFKGESAGTDLPTVLQNRNSLATTRGSTNIGGNISTIVSVASDLLNKIEQTGLSKTVDNFIAGGVKAGISNVFGGSNSGSNAFTQFLSGISNQASASSKSIFDGISNSSFTRTIRRTTDTIALYMPDTLVFTYNQHYDTPKTGGDVMSTAGALAAGAAAVDAYKSSDNPNAQGAQGVKNLAPFAAAALAKSKGGDLAKVLFAAGTGLAMNPMMEMIYSAPQFRSFRFDFMFYPRDEKEAVEVQNILQRLTFHQAPEIKSGSGGFFLVPPSEFDIQFYYNGQVNPNIPSITTCVLKMIDVDYAAVGQWAAYETPSELTPELGRTGMPVGIRLSLEFEETEIQTKDSYTRSNGSEKYRIDTIGF